MKIICDPENYTIEPCVATIGFFDGVHKGHQYLIEQVKAVAADKGLHTALITFPVHPRKVIDPDYKMEFLSTLSEKEELLDKTGVDYCFLLNFTSDISGLSAHDFMSEILKKQFKVDSLIIGYDHRFGHNRSEGFKDYYQYGKEIGMDVIHARAFTIEGHKISSSVIRTALLSGNLDQANSYLGYNYYLDGLVVTGHKIGRTIGFPTANLDVDSSKIIPANGVYAVRVDIAGIEYAGMINIGFRPTLNNGINRTIEVNIIDFNNDIYGKAIRVHFVKHIRSEIKFSSIDELKSQLHKDQTEVKDIFKSQI